jgi:hypothetical protein
MLPWLWGKDKSKSHVLAFAKSGNGVQAIEPTRKSIHLVYYENTDINHYIEWCIDKGYTVVGSTHEADLSSWKGITNIIPTCVSITKILTGFASTSITPQGLYKELLARGGVELNLC